MTTASTFAVAAEALDTEREVTSGERRRCCSDDCLGE